MKGNHRFIITLIVLGFTKFSFGQFDQIDEQARVIKIKKQTIETLAGTIKQLSSDPVDQVRALYVFIATNIAYDTNAFFTGSSSAIDPNDVLHAKKAVCQGYSNLFNAVCSELNIRSHIVAGFTKGYGFNGKMDGKSNHAWIAVYLNGKWSLIDPTWGSGYLNQKGKFVASFQPRYFMIDPTLLISKHLPEDPAFQLLACPIDVKSFMLDSVSIVNKVRNCKTAHYNYNDTINMDYSVSDSLGIMRQAKRTYDFSDFGAMGAAVKVLNLAWQKAAILNDQTIRLEEKAMLVKKVMYMYQLSLTYAKKSKAGEAKSVRNSIQENIDNLKKYSVALEKAMENK
ncbi:MAG: transglutaminase domain-containing protein [Salinivirgaceae bacterium]|nr:transglutaminase domain-containing protein [Salinivirgaceae bacterium]